MIKYSFENKVAIVTGAGNGIGFEIARKLYQSGASVILNDINFSLADHAVTSISQNNERCVAVPGDCSDHGVMDKMIEMAVERYGQVDFVICNAGLTMFCDFFEFTLNDFTRLLEVNLQGTFFMAQKAAKQFKKQGHGGRLIFMSSVTGHSAHPNLSAYGMTKAAIEMMAKNLSVELAPYRINVNAIAPGATLTERNLIDDPKYKEHWEQLIPTGRVGRPEDMANTVLFLLSEESRHINGQSIIVDGGWTSTSPTPE